MDFFATLDKKVKVTPVALETSGAEADLNGHVQFGEFT